MLSLSRSVGYIDEPFNPYFRTFRPGMCRAAFQQWFTYVSKENEEKFYDALTETMHFRFHLKEQINALIKNKYGFRTSLKDYSAFFANRYVYRPRPLIKDPIALFSTEWLARTFNMHVVILIRHPAAFVSSIKRMNWPHKFSTFLDQELLMSDHLLPFEEEIRRRISIKGDIVGDAILLWKMFYYFVSTLKQNHTEYLCVRHEDLSRDPIHEFKVLFNRLGLEFTERIERIIEKHSNSSNPAEAANGVMHQLKRNSLANIRNWKGRLSEQEVDRVREGTKNVWPLFYEESDWE